MPQQFVNGDLHLETFASPLAKDRLDRRKERGRQKGQRERQKRRKGEGREIEIGGGGERESE